MSRHHRHGEATDDALRVTIAVNLALTAAKWLAFFLTGSPSLFGEAAHSTADALNPLILGIGHRRSKRPADRRHPAGHSREVFFWALMAAVLMFLVGGIVTAFHGIEAIIARKTPEHSPYAIVILCVALFAECYSLGNSWKNHKAGNPVTLALLFENGTDLLAVVFALAGFGLYLLTGNPLWDAAFSLGIAALIFASSVFLMNRNRSLIIGEAAPAAITDMIEIVVKARLSVAEVKRVTAVMYGPHEIHCIIVIRWRTDWYNGHFQTYQQKAAYPPKIASWAITQVVAEINHIKKRVQEEIPDVTEISIEAALR